MTNDVQYRSYAEIRADLLAGHEIALLDVREEDPHAQAHPLFAANIPLGRLEQLAYARLPRRTVPITVLDNDEGLAIQAVHRLIELGYTDVKQLQGGLAGWRESGGEIFQDVNAPSKAFGELVEVKRHTPSISAEEAKAMIDAQADIVVLDSRRFDEYQTMSIPTATSVPGGELVKRARELAPNPETTVIVHCGGRTRSIIGTQSLINSGLENKVVALRNGTIGWKLAGLNLETDKARRLEISNSFNKNTAEAQSALVVADRAGVRRADRALLNTMLMANDRTTYCFDVRTPEEYVSGHLEGFLSAPGGQLVQETDFFAPVRGAQIILLDDDGVRANMAASWLAQMGWEVYVVDGIDINEFNVTGKWTPPLPPLPDVPLITAEELFTSMKHRDISVIDLAFSRDYIKQHIPGAAFALRWQFDSVLQKMSAASVYVLTSPDGVLARFAYAELQALTDAPVLVLDGGSEAWINADFAMESGATNMASPAIDRYRRPYEGTDNSTAAMQGYLDWEAGLVEQLERDGTHGFNVI